MRGPGARPDTRDAGRRIAPLAIAFTLVLMLAVFGSAGPARVSAATADDCDTVEVPKPPSPPVTATPTPTPTTTPTPDPTEIPTPDPTEIPTPDPTEIPTPEATPDVTETPTPDPTETATPDPTETATPDVTETPTAEPTETATPAAGAKRRVRMVAIDCESQTATTVQTTSQSTGFTQTGTTTILVPAPPKGSPVMIIRLSGVLTKTGARIRLLAVQAPVGARLSVRCSGRSCPTRHYTRTLAKPKLRVKRFERPLRAGTSVVLRLRVAGGPGKYTRFEIRRGRIPLRRDACLQSRSTRPVPC
jgi:hypothetical protein